MSTSPVSQYYVRVRGRVQGPYDLSRLKVLKARGQFSRVFEISEDGQTWTSSESLSELLDPAPAVFEEPTTGRGHAAVASASPETPLPDQRWNDWEPRRRRKAESHLGTTLLIMMLVIVPAGIVGGILLFQRLDRERNVVSNGDSLPEEEERIPVTFEYWTKFKAVRNGLRWDEGASPEAIAAKLRSTANEMADLPTLGVDSEAIQLVIDYSSALNQVASAMSEANDPSTYLEAFARGAAGDPFGKAMELKSSSDAALRQLAEVEQRSTRVRATLTSTYARQFP